MIAALRDRLADVRDWVFDLDNTLYPASSSFFPAIGARMTRFVARTLAVSEAEARRLQHLYYLEHGASLAGLMAHHGVDPQEFLRDVHDVDPAEHLTPDPALADLIGRLPGRKIVFTNGGRGHAARVLAHLGLDAVFDAHFAIEDAGFAPKPQPLAFERLMATHDVAPRAAIMFEDSARNLAPAYALGMGAVLVDPAAADAARPPTAPPHVHAVTDCLKRFLTLALEEVRP